VENVLKFLQQYQLEFHRTQAFCKKLKETATRNNSATGKITPRKINSLTLI
jgi:hypothetical protein